MDDSEATSLEQIRAFLAGAGDVRFAGQGRREVYDWTERTLVRFGYAELGKPEKGLVRRYIARLTGLSRAQVTRLITSYTASGRVKAASYQRRKFPTRYTKADVDLLAYVDRSHGNLSGPATKRILEREHHEYGQAAFERLAQISVAQIYRFRNSESYRKRNTSYQPTRPTPIPIGQRRKPRPEGRPGYLRIDTVHQGDRDGAKGLYHINAVDEVTQWEIVAATPQISELWLIPALEQILEQFPFVIRGFHSDNGSEFINYTVARLLEKLLIEQTKSRAYRSGDNGLVESKQSGGSQTSGLRPYRRPACRGNQSVSSPVFESVSQLPSALRRSPDRRRTGRQTASHLPTLGHALGNLQSDRGVRKVSEGGRQPCPAATVRTTTIRHRSSHRDATGQKETTGTREAQRLIGAADVNQESAVEMPGAGKRGKPKAGFPPFPPPLEIAAAIPTFPPRRRLVSVSKPKTENKTERSFPLPATFLQFRLILR